MTISEMNISCPLRVFDINSGSYISSLFDPHDPGDIPPDIGVLPVLGLRSVQTETTVVLYIDTAC